MINKENFKAMLRYLKFEEKGRLFRKDFEANGVFLEVDFVIEQLVYPEIAGLIVNERQTCNFSQAENAVVFECVNRLLEKGYKPEHLELEPKWKVGHGASGGRADILVKDHNKKPMLLIECKTYDKEFTKAWRETLEDGGQLFSYAQQISETEFLCLYASEFDDKNNTLNMQQRIISHKDNEKLLEKLEKPKTYKKASNVKNRYEVWKETYQQEYTETGIFEHNIQAYQIGKSKYTLDIDTRPIAETDIEGKYHRFRTILRQHNIARKETAFEVLVNLFLSKIVDEEENKTDLKFFWKGIAYDNYFDFVDRLQNLYQVGMKKFLDDEITYISNDQIDNAFWTVKNKRNATKKTIQEYFRKLKFFSNNAFSFINVHNERLFNKNAKVLVEIVQMWQSLRLKTKEQNQFLGDMFEYFLDNSIKQSEGQFFTPLPICKFIVMSLPLETKIQESSEPLRAIDYACGAGHFLTEYAHQIRPLLKKYKEIEPGDYYKNIFGIEKEDRLAKVAKVSAYMYGQDQINIVEEDALTEIQQIKNESFDVLVANPPFAVEGFLHNLSEKQKDQYELIQTTGYKSNTSNIQCFFIERAKQLMAPNGTVGIIVPSSVLSNSDSTHIMTREIILKYFDIISIVELGSGTFGKTGTNTVVLFLRRKPQKPEPAEHYRNRVEDYFEGIEENDQNLTEYQDLYLIKKYCEHTDLPFEEYKKLFGITPKTIGLLDELLKTDIFKEYKTYFDNSAEIKNLKTKTAFKKLSKEEQKTELNKRLINYLFAIEKDKLYYFMLAYENKQKVLVVKCPSGNKEVKQFLGYEWSGAKGSEGIRYNGGSTVNDIITDLFDPKNAQNYKKINYLIQQNFNGVKPDIDLKGFDNIGGLINYTSLMDILDFSRKDFNKAFSLAPKQTITIDTKWDLVKLGAVCEDPQYGANESAIDGNPKNDYRYIRITDIDENGYLLDDFKTAKNIEEQYILKDGDFLFARSGNTVGKTFLYKTSYGKAIYAGYLIRFRTNKSKLLPEFLNEFTNTKIYKQWVKHTQTGTSQPNINGQMYSGLLIPLPPLNIQQKIVQECEIIVKQSEQARKAVDEVKKEIENEFNSAFNQASKILRLSDSRIFDLSIGKRVLQKEIEQSEGIPVYSANVFEPFGFIKKELLKDFSKSSVIWGIDGDWMVNYMPANKPFYPTDHCGVVRVKNDVVHPRYLAWVLYKIGKEIRFSRHHRASIDRVKALSVKIPSIEIQNVFATKVEELENKIKEAKEIIEKANGEKQKIMEKYL